MLNVLRMIIIVQSKQQPDTCFTPFSLPVELVYSGCARGVQHQLVPAHILPINVPSVRPFSNRILCKGNVIANKTIRDNI